MMNTQPEAIREAAEMEQQRTKFRQAMFAKLVSDDAGNLRYVYGREAAVRRGVCLINQPSTVPIVATPANYDPDEPKPFLEQCIMAENKQQYPVKLPGGVATGAEQAIMPVRRNVSMTPAQRQIMEGTPGVIVQGEMPMEKYRPKHKRQKVIDANVDANATDIGAVTSAVSSVFPIGCFMQPVSLLPTWKARGCNFAFGFGGETKSDGSYVYSPDQWIDAATATGLATARDPSGIAAKNDSSWWGIVLDDEPESKNLPASYLAPKIAAYRAKYPGVPIILNLSGGYLLGYQKINGQPVDYAPYFKLDVDCFGADIYPVTGWGQNSPDWLAKVGDCIRVIKQAAPTKKALTFIETSNQKLSWVNGGKGALATPAEVRAMIWHAIIAGANMIVSFSDVFGAGWEGFDGTPADIAAEFTSNALMIQDLAIPLNSIGNQTADVAPFVSCIRTTPDGTQWTFTLNNSNTPVIHPKTGLHFRAYGVRWTRSDEGKTIPTPGPTGDATAAIAAMNTTTAKLESQVTRLINTQWAIVPKSGL